MRSRVWLKHKHKELWTNCPLCNAPIRWTYDGENWIPCDREPVSFEHCYDGTEVMIVHHKMLVHGTLNISNFETRIMGLLPHVYSCDELNGWEGKKVERI